MKYSIVFILVTLGFCSCEQVIRGVAEGSARSANIRDSLKFEYNEKPIAIERQDIIERKKAGKDSLFLVRGYFLDGNKYYDCWYKNDYRHGTTTYYFPSGKVQYTLEYKEGILYTLLNSYDEKGNEREGGTLKNGNGNLSIYHPLTGNLIYKGSYKNGLRDGKLESFFSDGNRETNFVFRNDTAIGDYAEYYHSGQLKAKGNLNPYGGKSIMESFYENGKPQAIEARMDGIRTGFKEYDENGFLIKERQIINGQFLGANYYYTDEGKMLSKGEMLEDKKHGKYEYFYGSGKRKTLETYSNDTILSETIWNENGKLSVENVYKNGTKNGVCKEYYITGNIRVEQMYVNGVEEGPYKSYFNSGKIYNDGQFKDGELTGDLKFYSEKGELTRTKKYN
jgi:antitoxin component YwqK of YwqJK toxin-antitoxin module